MKQRIYHLIKLLEKETNKKVMFRGNDEKKGFIKKIKSRLKEAKEISKEDLPYEFDSLSQLYNWLDSDDGKIFYKNNRDLFGSGEFEEFIFKANPRLTIDPDRMSDEELACFWTNLVYNRVGIPNRKEKADFIYNNYFEKLKYILEIDGTVDDDKMTADGEYNFN